LFLDVVEILPRLEEDGEGVVERWKQFGLGAVDRPAWLAQFDEPSTWTLRRYEHRLCVNLGDVCFTFLFNKSVCLYVEHDHKNIQCCSQRLSWLGDKEKDLRSNKDKDLRLKDKDKDVKSEDKDKDLRLKDKDKDLRPEDKEKDLSVYANWTTAGNLFVIKIKITCAQ